MKKGYLLTIASAHAGTRFSAVIHTIAKSEKGLRIKTALLAGLPTVLTNAYHREDGVFFMQA